MTEQDIAETITSRRMRQGIEAAEELVFAEYDDVYSEWNNSGVDSSVPVERVNELELAMVSLRIARDIIEESSLDDDTLQEIATSVQCETASLESIEDTAEQVISSTE